MNESLLVGLLSAGGGAAVVKALDFLLTRMNKRDDREDAKEDKNDEISLSLMEGLRKENTELRERMSRMDGQFFELRQNTVGILDENYKLREENAVLRAQVTQLMTEIATLRSRPASAWGGHGPEEKPNA